MDQQGQQVAVRVFRSDGDFIALSASFFWFKFVVVGKPFLELPRHLRNAVMSHEQGHVDLHHLEKGWLCLLVTPWLFFRLCRKQELEADAYAAQRGHASALLELLRYDERETYSHPSNAERRKHLKQYE